MKLKVYPFYVYNHTSDGMDYILEHTLAIMPVKHIRKIFFFYAWDGKNEIKL